MLGGDEDDALGLEKVFEELLGGRQFGQVQSQDLRRGRGASRIGQEVLNRPAGELCQLRELVLVDLAGAHPAGDGLFGHPEGTGDTFLRQAGFIDGRLNAASEGVFFKHRLMMP